MQKAMMVFSVSLMAFVGIFGYPMLARQYSANEFALITVLLFLNGFFGVFDLVKPAMIRHLALCKGRVGVHAYLVLSMKSAGFVSVITFFVFSFAFSKYVDFISALYISLSVFVFLVYSVLWAVFEIKGMVGWASFIRAIGFSLFMLGMVGAGFFDVDVSPVLTFFISHVFVGVTFLYFGRGFFAFGRYGSEEVAFRDLLLTAPQNLSKVVIDFSDRALVSMQGGPVFAAAYNAVYDVSAKVNIFSQLIVAYNYPGLCRGEGLNLFVNIGLAVSIILGVIAVGMIPVGDSLMGLYLGQQYTKFSVLVPVMFLLSSLYSLAFFSQGALRSLGMFEMLALHFLVCALGGVAFMLIFFILYGFYGVIGSLFVLKAPGILGYFYLRYKYRFGFLFDCLLFSYVSLFFIFIGCFYFEVVA